MHLPTCPHELPARPPVLPLQAFGLGGMLAMHEPSVMPSKRLPLRRQTSLSILTTVFHELQYGVQGLVVEATCSRRSSGKGTMQWGKYQVVFLQLGKDGAL